MASEYRAGLRVSEYLLQECIGRGAFGEVWRARHHIWEDEQVAIKLPAHGDGVRVLQREGVVTHDLRHPNIVRVIGLDPYADVPYLVMELVRGPSLREVIAQHRGGVPLGTAVTVLRGVLGALQAAHAAGVLHRDLKPGNVLLDLNGRALGELRTPDVKVGDFGLGRVNVDTLQSLDQSVSLAREEGLVGTLAYMAPELRDGAQPDARSDLYSLGVILFELLTGERPAGAELPSALRRGIPQAIDRVYQRLYARRESRYESAQAALEDLFVQLRGSARHRERVPRAGGTHLYVYEYTAVDPGGQLYAGEVVARSCAEAEHRLRTELGLAPLYVAGADAPTGASRAPRTSRPGAPGHCPACAAPVLAEDQFCTSCGQQLTEVVRRCPSCQAYPGPQDSFCIFCGTRLPAPSSSSTRRSMAWRP